MLPRRESEASSCGTLVINLLRGIAGQASKTRSAATLWDDACAWLQVATTIEFRSTATRELARRVQLER
jgi:hypothetical protein